MSKRRHLVGNVALAFGVRYDGFDPNDRREVNVFTVEFNDVIEPGTTHMRILKNGVVVPKTEQVLDTLTENERAGWRASVAGLGEVDQKVRAVVQKARTAL
jgi:hypothetical protein